MVETFRKLSGCLETLACYIPAQLVPHKSLALISGKAGKLPFDVCGRAFGFETALDISPAHADFGACIDREGRKNLLQAAADNIPEEHSGKNIRLLCEHWAGANAVLMMLINNLWLEYDTSEEPQFCSTPGLFSTLNVRTWQYPVQAWLPPLLGLLAGTRPAVPVYEKIRELAERLPLPARISQIGYWRSRNPGTYRVCIKGLNFRSLSSFLQNLDLSEELERYADIVQGIAAFTDFPVLHLDVGQHISDRIGIEFRLAGDDLDPAKQPRWQPLLEFLTCRGLCCPEKRDTLMAWHGKSWEITDPALSRYATYRMLYYLKGIFIPGREPRIKAYFGFLNSTRFLEKNGHTPGEQDNAGTPGSPAPAGNTGTAAAPDNRLHSRLKESIRKALEFLSASQMHSGEFRCYIAQDPLLKAAAFDSSVFVTTFVLYTTLFLPPAGVQSLRDRALAFFEKERRPGSLWSYWTKQNSRTIYPDIDDTCCASFLIRRLAPHKAPHENIELLLKNRTRAGLFKTWFDPSDTDNAVSDVDSVANANALLYLGEREETKAVCRYLLDCVEKGEEKDSYWYYLSNAALYYMLSRAFYNGVVSLQPAGNTITDNILTSQHHPDVRSNDLETALCLCTLLNFACTGNEIEVMVSRLMTRQQENGMWNRCPFYCGPGYPAAPNVWFGSAEMTTALCLEALARFSALY